MTEIKPLTKNYHKIEFGEIGGEMVDKMEKIYDRYCSSKDYNKLTLQEFMEKIYKNYDME